MQRLFSSVLGLLFITTALPGQIWQVDPQNQTPFSLIESATAASEAEPIKDGEEYDKAYEIYRQLVRAKGDYRYDPPKFFLNLTDTQGAFLAADNLSIGMDRKVFRICQHFGDGAVAAVLGHELTHFYEKHIWQDYFLASLGKQQDSLTRRNAALALGTAPADEQAEQDLVSANRTARQSLMKQINESQSDYLGGFLAYSAGYDISSYPAALDSIYRAYEYDDAIPGYGTLAERKAMLQATQARLREFIDVHEMANLLLTLSYIPYARVLYKGILQEYQGTEVYNNLGFLTVMEALEYFTDAEKQYRLPLELDLGLGTNSRGAPGELDEKVYRANLLREAIGYFRSAVNLNPDYAPAYQNMGVAYYLLTDYDRAAYFAKHEARPRAEADPATYPQTATNARILLALIDLAGDPDRQQAGKDSLQALAAASPLADANFRIADQQRPRRVRIPRGPRLEISGKTADSILVLTQNAAAATTLQFFFKEELKVWDKAVDHARIYQFQPRYQRSTGLTPPPVSIMITDPDYPADESQQYTVGTPGSEILAERKEPAIRLTTVTGEIWVYRDDGTILILDQDQKLRRWALVKKD